MDIHPFAASHHDRNYKWDKDEPERDSAFKGFF